MKCNDCRERGACIVELDPRYAHLCAKAARGTASDLAQIRALTARRGSTPAPEPPPAA